MRKWILVLLLLTLVLSGCGEDGRYGFTFVNQGEHVLESGQIMTSDTAIAGGNVTFEEGSILRGSIYLFGGTLTIDSRVDGDVAALGGSITLGDGADIAGDFYVAGSDVTRSPGATIAGEDTALSSTEIGLSNRAPASTIPTFILQLVLAGLTAAVFAAVAVRLMPTLTTRLAATSAGYPLVSGAMGLLLLLVVPMFLVFMVFTIVLIPGTIVGVVVLGLLALYGFVGLSRGVGERITRWRNLTLSSSSAAALGAATIAILLSVLTLFPLVGEIALALVGAVALGSVMLSGFGTRVYVPPNFEPDTEPA